MLTEKQKIALETIKQNAVFAFWSSKGNYQYLVFPPQLKANLVRYIVKNRHVSKLNAVTAGNLRDAGLVKFVNGFKGDYEVVVCTEQETADIIKKRDERRAEIEQQFARELKAIDVIKGLTHE